MRKKLLKLVVALSASLLYIQPAAIAIHAETDNPCGSIDSEADRQACRQYQAELSSQNKELASQLQDIEAKRAEISANIAKYADQIKQYQGQIDDLNSKITDLNNQINAKQAEIDQTTADMEAKQADIDENQKQVDEIGSKVKQRMADGQGTMRVNTYIDILMGAKTFSDFLRLLNGISDITQYDQKTTNELVDAVDKLNADKKELSKLKDKQEQEQQDLEDSEKAVDEQKQQVAVAQANVQVIQDAAEDQAAELEAQGQTVASNISDVKATINANSSSLDDYQAKLDAAAAAAAAASAAAAQQNNNNGSGSGSADSGTTTDNNSGSSNTPAVSNGWVNPVPGARRSAGTWNYPGGGRHLGYDFAAAQGTTIRAIGAGYVINSADGCSYGALGSTCHGNGGSNGGGNQVYLITTLGNTLYAVKYLHMQNGSPIAKGTFVSAGQAIGRVGATGNVTGPHCHIEIFMIGSASDFTNYIRSWNGDLAFGCGWAGSYDGDGYGRRCDHGYGIPCRIRPENYF